MHNNAYKIAKLLINNQYDIKVDIISKNNDKNYDDYTYIDLAKFEIYIKALLANNVRKIRYKQTVVNYFNNNKINIIIILITNLRFEFFYNKNSSISIHHY